MSDQIRRLLEQIHNLEEELRAALHEQEVKINYRIEGRRIKFERMARQAHRKLKVGILRWFRQSRPQNVFSAPFIYSMIVPFLILDVWVTVYQAICFRLYGIARVPRSRYIVVDHHHLAYLNSLEKLNCVYCGYASGLIAYTREIAARTEQYWCPIKHAHKVLGSHDRYARFIDYADAADYHERLREFRAALVEASNAK